MDEGDSRRASVTDGHVNPSKALVEHESSSSTWRKSHCSGAVFRAFGPLEHLALFCVAQEREHIDTAGKRRGPHRDIMRPVKRPKFKDVANVTKQQVCFSGEQFSRRA